MILARLAPVLLGAIALGGCFSLPPPPAATAPSNIGDPAPVFSLERLNGGGTLSLRSLRGKTVVLWFYPKADTPG